jgi:hypothetical protein
VHGRRHAGHEQAQARDHHKSNNAHGSAPIVSGRRDVLLLT